MGAAAPGNGRESSGAPTAAPIRVQLIKCDGSHAVRAVAEHQRDHTRKTLDEGRERLRRIEGIALVLQATATSRALSAVPSGGIAIQTVPATARARAVRAR